jgi:hypothetical protein
MPRTANADCGANRTHQRLSWGGPTDRFVCGNLFGESLRKVQKMLLFVAKTDRRRDAGSKYVS